MKKIKIICSILITVLFCSLILSGCKPKTGFAKITLNKNYHETKSNYFLLSADYIGSSVNFRDYVEVNDETTWVLSKTVDGKNAISSYCVNLYGGLNTYYIVCSDRIGISKTYRIDFLVERKTVNLYYLFLDEKSLYDYLLRDYNNYANGKGDGIFSWYGSFSDYYWEYAWRMIKEHKGIGDKMAFYEEVAGTEWKESLPRINPKQSGYEFIEWRGASWYINYFNQDSMSCIDSGTIYHVYVATWQPKSN